VRQSVCFVKQASVPVRPVDYKTFLISLIGIIVALATLYDLSISYFSCNEYLKNANQNAISTQLLMAFSVIRNTKDILDVANTQKSGQIGPLHFMRFISMIWVVVGHSSLLFMILSPNILDSKEALKDLGAQLLTNAFFAVDTFFFMSGLLLAFLWFKEYRTNKIKLSSTTSWLTFYLHCIIRLSPPYYITIAFYTFIFKILLVNMPVLLLSANDYCEEIWWTTYCPKTTLILHIFICHIVIFQCYTLSCYLAVNFQFYLFAQICSKPLKPILGFCIAGLLLFSTQFKFATAYKEYFPPSDFSGVMDPRMGPASRYRLLIYDAPWIRCQVYIVGILVGYLLQTKKTLRIPKTTALTSLEKMHIR
uniref:Acyl_transf_3 domain-containing protein n=1 Tax=Thelazia callipaeda TaxID=103827 RepID=A0A0N5D9A0_THECL